MKQNEQIGERPELRHKPAPLTCGADHTVREAVAAMNGQNYGCILVTDAQDHVTGILTERDVMRRVVHAGRSADDVSVGEVMTTNPRCARHDDLVLDWLRVMSNERFRRIPVLDEHGKLSAIFTMGDFVAYTWPDLMYDRPRPSAGTSTDLRMAAYLGGGMLAYTLVIATVFLLM